MEISHDALLYAYASIGTKDMKSMKPDATLVTTVYRACADAYGVSVNDMKGRRRWEPLATARRMAVGILVEQVSGYSTVARLIDRDHTTVLYLAGAHEAHRAASSPYEAKYRDVCASLGVTAAPRPELADTIAPRPSNQARVKAPPRMPKASVLEVIGELMTTDETMESIASRRGVTRQAISHIANRAREAGIPVRV